MTDPRTVADIVSRLLGSHVEVELVKEEEDSVVYRASNADRTVYFKGGRGGSVRCAAWVHAKAASLGIPVPEVLEADESCQRWPHPYFVMTSCPGEPAWHADPPVRRRLAGECGDLLRALHSVELPGFGWMGLAEDPSGSCGSHEEWIRDTANWGLGYLREQGLLEEDAARAAEEIVQRHHELVPAPAQGVLLHGDFSFAHIYHDPASGALTGIIDFQPSVADPALDLATFLYHHPDVEEAFLAGYRPDIPDLDVRVKLYAMDRALAVARWEHEHGRPHAEDLDRARELGVELHSQLPHPA